MGTKSMKVISLDIDLPNLPSGQMQSMAAWILLVLVTMLTLMMHTDASSDNGGQHHISPVHSKSLEASRSGGEVSWSVAIGSDNQTIVSDGHQSVLETLSEGLNKEHYSHARRRKDTVAATSNTLDRDGLMKKHRSSQKQRQHVDQFHNKHNIDDTFFSLMRVNPSLIHDNNRAKSSTSMKILNFNQDLVGDTLDLVSNKKPHPANPQAMMAANPVILQSSDEDFLLMNDDEGEDNDGAEDIDNDIAEIPNMLTSDDIYDHEDDPNRCYDLKFSSDCNHGYMCVKLDQHSGSDRAVVGTCKSIDPHEDCWRCSGLKQICPKDSILIAPSYPTCCNTTSVECKCAECPKLECGQNQSLMILAFGTGNPGSCCDNYKCAGSPNMCVYADILHAENETWKPDKCTACRCERGLVYCKRQRCEPSAGCGFMYIPKDDCCPACSGCMSDNRIFAQNQSWYEDDGCFQCHCKNGRTRCTAEYCLSPPCVHPRKLKDVCCPVCDELPDSTNQNKTKCNVLDGFVDCDLQCEFGFQHLVNGCPLCSCRRPQCPTACPYGFAVKESSSRRGCDCRVVGCDQIECNKRCMHGLETDSDTKCPLCHCRKCPQIKCHTQCPQGSRLDSFGCSTCDCATEQDVLTPLLNTSLIPYSSCMIKEAHKDHYHLIQHMEIFFDGCRDCICINGLHFCSLIPCPIPSCPMPTIPPGTCCPSCSTGDLHAARTMHGEQGRTTDKLCVPSGHAPLLNGETLTLDSCTTCVCHNSKSYCDASNCASLAKCPLAAVGQSSAASSLSSAASSSSSASSSPALTFISYLPGRQENPTCCPDCHRITLEVEHNNNNNNNNNNDNSQKDRPVVNTSSPGSSCRVGGSGDVGHQDYIDGDTWQPDLCRACLCKSGASVCFRQSCQAVLNCSVAYLKKGACCPFCLERAQMAVCVFDDLIYRNGEGWNVNDCTRCTCRQGQIVCSKLSCPPLTCEKPVSIQGQCCPVCPHGISVDDKGKEIITVHDVIQSTYPSLMPGGSANQVGQLPSAVTAHYHHHHQAGMLYAGLLGTIILLVILVVILLLLIIWRGNLLCDNNGDVQISRRIIRQRRRRKVFPNHHGANGSLFGSICNSMQFEAADGAKLLGSNGYDGEGLRSSACPACPNCGAAQGHTVIRSHNNCLHHQSNERYTKYDVIGNQSGKEGSSKAVGKKENGLPLSATAALGCLHRGPCPKNNMGASSSLLMLSSNRSPTPDDDVTACCTLSGINDDRTASHPDNTGLTMDLATGSTFGSFVWNDQKASSGGSDNDTPPNKHSTSRHDCNCDCGQCEKDSVIYV